MPGRYIPLVNDEVYHVFNRGIDKRPTFTDKLELKRALRVLKYYQSSSPPIKLSRFLTLHHDDQDLITKQMSKLPKLVNILSFCLMPNHFHFLLKQLQDNGISTFLSLLQNSYTRYFNTKHERVGPLFLDQFKAVRIETDEQLIHVSRYIHLNPYSSFITKSWEDLLKYRWSSLPEYLTKAEICDTDFILSLFKNARSYKKFVSDQADYQRKLDVIKHLTLE